MNNTADDRCPYYPGCQQDCCTRCWEHDAFKLGFAERLSGGGAFGRTWDNQDLNEAYDRGMNAAEELFS